MTTQSDDVQAAVIAAVQRELNSFSDQVSSEDPAAAYRDGRRSAARVATRGPARAISPRRSSGRAPATSAFQAEIQRALEERLTEFATLNKRRHEEMDARIGRVVDEANIGLSAAVESAARPIIKQVEHRQESLERELGNARQEPPQVRRPGGTHGHPLQRRHPRHRRSDERGVRAGRRRHRRAPERARHPARRDLGAVGTTAVGGVEHRRQPGRPGRGSHQRSPARHRGPHQRRRRPARRRHRRLRRPRQRRTRRVGRHAERPHRRGRPQVRRGRSLVRRHQRRASPPSTSTRSTS